MATATGGEAHLLDELEALAATYAAILSDVRAQYRLAFTPPAGASGMRRVEVRTKNPRSYRVDAGTATRSRPATSVHALYPFRTYSDLLSGDGNARMRYRIRTRSALILCLLAGLACGNSREETSAEPLTLDCSSSTLGLTEEAGDVLHRDGPELHASWLIAGSPDLWQSVAAVPTSLRVYRETVREVLTDVSPLGLIRANRERNPWLEREHAAERTINTLVEAGHGTHRPMNCLETQILAFQAARFPLYEQPTEIVALILQRTEFATDQVKVYVAADDDSVVPKPDDAVAGIEAEITEGWRFVAVFHNHTFSHDPDRGLLPVAAPSASDLQVSVALADRLGLESILVADGFSTLELTAAEFRELAEAALGVPAVNEPPGEPDPSP